MLNLFFAYNIEFKFYTYTITFAEMCVGFTCAQYYLQIFLKDRDINFTKKITSLKM